MDKRHENIIIALFTFQFTTKSQLKNIIRPFNYLIPHSFTTPPAINLPARILGELHVKQ